ncbi:MAG: hypothetical protein WBA74_23565 [Cyclobacteriaceae bacterium]
MDIILLLAGTLAIVLFKSNTIRMHLVIFVYPIWVMFLTKSDVYIPGIISAIGLDYYEQYVATAFWWALIGYYTFVVLLWGKRKVRVQFETVLIEEKSRVILVGFTVIVAAIFMPRVFFISDERFNLLPFFAWGALYNVMSVILIISHQNFKRTSSIIHLMLLVFIMARGERADQIMVLLSLFLFSGIYIKNEIKINYKFAIGGGLLFMVVSFIGIIRIIGFQNFIEHFTFYLGLSFYAQQTAADVTHVYMSSVLFYFQEPPDYAVVMNLPLSILPGLPGGGSAASNNYINTLMQVVPSYGGGLFYAEAAMNFGVLGIMFYAASLALLIRYSLACDTLLKKIITFVVFTMVFRVHWYGLLYIIKPIYISLLLVVILKYFTKKFTNDRINENSPST